MGRPVLEPDKIPVQAEGSQVVNEALLVDGKEYRMTCVSMGNPHAVILWIRMSGSFLLNRSGLLLRIMNGSLSGSIQSSSEYLTAYCGDARVGTGIGRTLACGTGTCAAAVACVLNGLTEDEITVHLLGGDLYIRWDRENDTVYMTGPAETVFDGECRNKKRMRKLQFAAS